MAAVEQQTEVLRSSIQELIRKKERLVDAYRSVDGAELLDAGIHYWQEESGELEYMEEDLASELHSLKQLFEQEDAADRRARAQQEQKPLLPDSLQQYR